MNLLGGFYFLFLIMFFGYINYLFMMRRYKNDLKKRQVSQFKNISRLYPKGTFIKTYSNF